MRDAHGVSLPANAKTNQHIAAALTNHNRLAFERRPSFAKSGKTHRRASVSLCKSDLIMA